MKINKEKHEKSPVDANKLYTQAYDYYAAGKYEDAEGFFRLLTSITPKAIEIWMGLGASLQMQKKLQDAIDCFGVAAIIDEKEVNPFPHMHAADCFWALNQKEKATLALKSAMLIAKKESKHDSLLKKLQFLHKRWTHA